MNGTVYSYLGGRSVDSIVKLKKYFNEKNYEALVEIGKGYSAATYILKDDLAINTKVCLKVGANLHKEVFILNKFSGVKSLPELYHNGKDHSIVEYCKLMIPHSRPRGLTDNHVLKLLDDLAFMAADGIIITDLSVTNISFSIDKGFKIIDTDNYTQLESITVGNIVNSSCGRLWFTLGYYVGKENVEQLKTYYEQTVSDVLGNKY